MELVTLEGGPLVGVVHEEQGPEGKAAYALEVAIHGQHAFVADEQEIEQVAELTRAYAAGAEKMSADDRVRMRGRHWSLEMTVGRFGMGNFQTLSDEWDLDYWTADLRRDNQPVVASLEDKEVCELNRLASETRCLINDYLRQGKTVQAFAEERGHEEKEGQKEAEEVTVQARKPGQKL